MSREQALHGAGGRDGRETIQTRTHPNSPAITAKAQSGQSRDIVNHAKLPAIATDAAPLAHGGMTRWSSQPRINVPNRG